MCLITFCFNAIFCHKIVAAFGRKKIITTTKHLGAMILWFLLQLNNTHSIQYKNGCLAASNIFHMFAQSIKFYTFQYHVWRWLLGLRKLRSSKKIGISQVILVLQIVSWKSVIFYCSGKKRCFFPSFRHEIIFYSAELFDCAFNFKFF